MRKMYSKEQPVKAGIFLTRQCFIREGKKALFLILCVFVSSYSFAQDAFTVTWPLTADGSATKAGDGEAGVIANNVYVGAAYKTQIIESDGLVLAEGNGTGAWWTSRNTLLNSSFSGPGAETDMYVEFSITAGPDKDLKVNNIKIPLSRPDGQTGNLHYNTAYSLDGFTTINYIQGTNATPVSTTSSITSLNYTNEITVPKSKTLSVRFIIWRKNSAAIGKSDGSSARTAISIGKDVVISGERTLPVSLASFTGKLQNNTVELSWVTASEKGNSHFDILRSADGKTFNKIDYVQGHGTSDVINNYSYTDRFPYKGDNYYKLKQVDFNGNSEESQVIAVKALADAQEIKVYQQGNTIYLEVYAAVSGLGTLTITDISGKAISSQKIELTAGRNQFNTDLSTGSKGVYLVNMVSSGQTLSAKLIK